MKDVVIINKEDIENCRYVIVDCEKVAKTVKEEYDNMDVKPYKNKRYNLKQTVKNIICEDEVMFNPYLCQVTDYIIMEYGAELGLEKEEIWIGE